GAGGPHVIGRRRRSRRANRVRRLEALPATSREADLQGVLTSGSQPERDERVIAYRASHREPTHSLRAVENLELGEIERLGVLDEPSIADGQARTARVADRKLN